MRKRLEQAWNARTPVYLHNGTKENFVFQLALTVVLISGIVAKEKYDNRQELKKRNQRHLTSV